MAEQYTRPDPRLRLLNRNGLDKKGSIAMNSLPDVYVLDHGPGPFDRWTGAYYTWLRTR